MLGSAREVKCRNVGDVLGMCTALLGCSQRAFAGHDHAVASTGIKKFHYGGKIRLSIPMHSMWSGFIGYRYDHRFHERRANYEVSKELKAYIEEHCKHGARHVFERFLMEIHRFPNDRSSINQSQVCNLYFLTVELCCLSHCQQEKCVSVDFQLCCNFQP
jgi:hypothetical protein